jgi:hypothetical protein
LQGLGISTNRDPAAGQIDIRLEVAVDIQRFETYHLVPDLQAFTNRGWPEAASDSLKGGLIRSHRDVGVGDVHEDNKCVQGIPGVSVSG